MTIFIADSHSFTIPTSSHSPGLWLPGGYASHDLYPAPLGASLHCQGRSLFSPIASPGDTGGPRPLSGDNFSTQRRVAHEYFDPTRSSRFRTFWFRVRRAPDRHD